MMNNTAILLTVCRARSDAGYNLEWAADKAQIGSPALSILPDHVLDLSVDEKSQIQGLNRTQSVLSKGLSYVEGVTYNYVWHDTTTLFAICRSRHRHRNRAD